MRTVKELNKHLFLDWKHGHWERIDGLEVQQMEFVGPLAVSLRRYCLHNEVFRKQSGEIHTCTEYWKTQITMEKSLGKDNSLL